MNLADQVRKRLIEVASQGEAITYQSLAKQLELMPPNTILQLTTALEKLMAEDAAAGRPMIAALVIGKGAGSLPRQGFFEAAHRVGRFDKGAAGADASRFHRQEFERAVAFWA